MATKTTRPATAPASQGRLVPIGGNYNTVSNLFRQIAPTIARMVPSTVKPDRLLEIAWFTLRTSVGLQECTTGSFLASVIKCGYFNMYPDGRGLVWFIPRRTGPRQADGQRTMECCFQFGYQGLLELCRRSGEIEMIDAHPVYEADTFSWEYGSNQYLTHIPNEDGDVGRLRAAYAIAWKRGARQPIFRVMTAKMIERIKTNAQTGRKPDSPWVKWEPEMWQKVAVARLCKLLPASVELQEARRLDDLSEIGESQHLDEEVFGGQPPLDGGVEMGELLGPAEGNADDHANSADAGIGEEVSQDA